MSKLLIRALEAERVTIAYYRLQADIHQLELNAGQIEKKLDSDDILGNYVKECYEYENLEKVLSTVSLGAYHMYTRATSGVVRLLDPSGYLCGRGFGETVIEAMSREARFVSVEQAYDMGYRIEVLANDEREYGELSKAETSLLDAFLDEL